MIKFFRKIRQKTLTENKFGKYLTYAIGEIILVVIGILIALSINNWNENRKNSIEEKAILENLLENLNLSKIQSEQLISEESQLKQNLIQILGVDSKDNKVKDKTISDSIFKNAVWDLQSDMPTFNAYNNLKSTNKLSLIKNKNINEKFTELEFRQNKLNDILEDRLSVHQIRIDDILEHDINFIPLVKSNIPTINIENESRNNYLQVLEIKRIRNLLGMKLSFTQDVIDFRKNLDKQIKDLIILIEKELNEKK
ncbi:MAG: hypothetical protein COZ74_06020 [Flavobacteriaceae bacterium CG_4_8_14_3_um_filter_31_8]|nr:MAG: hypothetical protein COW43_05370 [Flavobacteriaceae bacterium CG17_big_fil_post_rev_8_21_14_2_50_31_13]PIX13484.1 MAG: hypothetical protein COZ74_06020 [Flavobacteriaceae bacterium CG_4_8_14_3_um_filter_31_8]